MMGIIDDEEEMKDYEMIEIDGVNVSECEFFDSKYCKLCDMRAALNELIVHRQYCDRTVNKNCYFKQLQRLKQENELIKQSNQAWGLTVSNLRAENELMKKAIEKCIENSGIECDDEEQAINSLSRIGLTMFNSLMRNEELKQALEEIRKPATRLKENNYRSMNEVEADIDRILNKINEVLADK